MHFGRLYLTAALFVSLAACAQTPWPVSGGSESAHATVRVEAGYREYTGFMPTTDRQLAPREEGCAVDVVLDGRPSRDFEVVGLASAERLGQALIEEGGGEERTVEWLKAVACQVGGHVIFDVRTETARSAYVGRSLRGRAVVAVYTDGAAAPTAPAPPPAEATPPPAAPPAPPEGSADGWGTPAPPAETGGSGWGAPEGPEEEAADETF